MQCGYAPLLYLPEKIMTKYCLICSAARSGSTLLDLLIGGHSRAASLGEFSFLGKAISLNQKCSCGESIHMCIEWKKVFDYVKQDMGVDLLNNPYALKQWDTRASVIIDYKQQTKLYFIANKIRTVWCDVYFELMYNKCLRIALPKSLREGISNSAYLYDVVSAEWDKSLIVDSSKNVHKALALYEKFPENVRIIYLTRDGRGVYNSRRSTFSRSQSIGGWYKYNKRASHLFGKCIPEEGILHLKYEDLVGDLEGSLMSICEFLDAGYEASMMDLGHGERHLVNGNNTMFKRDRGVKLDERWKSELSNEDIQYFNKRCGELNSILGYS